MTFPRLSLSSLGLQRRAGWGAALVGLQLTDLAICEGEFGGCGFAAGEDGVVGGAEGLVLSADLLGGGCEGCEEEGGGDGGDVHSV